MSRSILSASIAAQCAVIQRHADALAESLAALAALHNGVDSEPLFRCSDETMAQIVAALQRIDASLDRLDPLVISR